MIKDECVDRESWVSEEEFKRVLAVYQVLPGPEAHELCVYFGRLRAGKRGGFLAGLGFMLPGFVLMLGLSIAYVEADLAGSLDELFYGLNAAVGAILARALVRLGRSFVTDVALAILAVAAFALTLSGSIGFILILAAAGIAYELWTNRRRWGRRDRTGSLSPAGIGMLVAGAGSLPVIGTIFWEGLQAGLLTFGGAFTAIPFLREASIDSQGWLTETQFVDGLAMGAVLPAPLIIFSTFVGYVAGGLGGSLAMTLGIFIPAFAFPIFLHRFLVAIASDDRLRPFLLGVTAAVVGLIAAVAVDILETAVIDVPTALLAIGAFAALNRWHARSTIVAVVLACGLVGAALQSWSASCDRRRLPTAPTRGARLAGSRLTGKWTMRTPSSVYYPRVILVRQPARA